MERLTRKSDTSDMVWFIDREHETGCVEREPYDMDAHHVRIAIARLAEYEDMQEKITKRIEELKASSNYPHFYKGQMVEDFEWVLNLLN